LSVVGASNGGQSRVYCSAAKVNRAMTDSAKHGDD